MQRAQEFKNKKCRSYYIKEIFQNLRIANNWDSKNFIVKRNQLSMKKANSQIYKGEWIKLLDFGLND